MLLDGCIDRSFTGLAYSQADECWYYAAQGSVNPDFTGFIKDGRRTIYAESSKVDWSVSGILELDGVKYFLKGSVLQEHYTGPYTENGILYIIKSGTVSAEIVSR